jgi:hypothetical protein
MTEDKAQLPSIPIDMAQRMVQEAFNLWINPEIERRRSANTISSSFHLRAAQVIFNIGAGRPEIRLNEEVKAVMKIKVNKPMKKGDVVKIGDIDEVGEFHLTEEDDNAGHLTILVIGNKFHLSFDARYNAGRVKEVLKVAQEFIEAATFASDNNHTHAFVDNLFSATELIAKGQLLLLPDKAMLTTKSHHYIASRYNFWGRLGNTDSRYVELFNKLTQLRTSARYVRSKINLSVEKRSDMLKIAKEMLLALNAGIPRRSKL